MTADTVLRLGMMLVICLVSLGLVALVAFVHNLGLMQLARLPHHVDSNRIWVPPVMIFGMALVHLSEILIFALAYMGLHEWTSLAGFKGDFEPTFLTYFYFSGATYTTLGLSDVYPTGETRILVIFEALTGFLMITWSATFFYRAAGRFLKPESVA